MNNKYNQLVEKVVPVADAAKERIQFTDEPYLRGAFIYGIEVFTINDMSLSPQQNALITGAQLKKSYITFYTTNPIKGANNLLPNGNMDTTGSGEYIQQLPLSVMHTLQNSGNDPFERWPYQLNGQSIIWEKSYITVPGGLGNGANVSFLFNVNFELNPTNTTN